MWRLHASSHCSDEVYIHTTLIQHNHPHTPNRDIPRTGGTTHQCSMRLAVDLRTYPRTWTHGAHTHFLVVGSLVVLLFSVFLSSLQPPLSEIPPSYLLVICSCMSGPVSFLAHPQRGGKKDACIWREILKPPPSFRHLQLHTYTCFTGRERGERKMDTFDAEQNTRGQRRIGGPWKIWEDKCSLRLVLGDEWTEQDKAAEQRAWSYAKKGKGREDGQLMPFCTCKSITTTIKHYILRHLNTGQHIATSSTVLRARPCHSVRDTRDRAYSDVATSSIIPWVLE